MADKGTMSNEANRLDTDMQAEALKKALAALGEDEQEMAAACAEATEEDRARELETELPEATDGRF